MKHNKIIPCLWYNADGGRISNVIEYYRNIFNVDFEGGQIIPLGPTPSGYTEMCNVQIFGQKVTLIDTEKEHHRMNDSISFMINCINQEEIDKYWNYFTKEGEESQCGWCIDKFGLRWQVVPVNMAELMSRPGASEVMMKQKKIVMDEYLR
jgi:predicted 3-demethylubiquinone-9 3-methyltransferase (glyoxalase superfamily)